MLKEQRFRWFCEVEVETYTHTLSTQDSLGGLEAKSVTGDWLSADPITGAILINVGDLLENLTSGR